jgi:hypothetical protein
VTGAEWDRKSLKVANDFTNDVKHIENTEHFWLGGAAFIRHVDDKQAIRFIGL